MWTSGLRNLLMFVRTRRSGDTFGVVDARDDSVLVVVEEKRHLNIIDILDD
jgi:hypothetical protein